MANLKVKVLHPKVYGFDSKHLTIGEHDLDEKLAKALIKSKKAELVEAKKSK